MIKGTAVNTPAGIGLIISQPTVGNMLLATVWINGRTHLFRAVDVYPLGINDLGEIITEIAIQDNNSSPA